MLEFTCSSTLLLLVTITSAEVPSQVHLAFAGERSDGSPDGVSVGWFYQNEISQTTVQYGYDGVWKNITGGPGRQYIRDYGYHHEVILSGLLPGKQYEYKLGPSVSDMTDTFRFTAAPATNDFKPFGISIYGDMGWEGSKERPFKIPAAGGLKENWTAVPTRATIEKLKNDGEIDFLWHLGDIAYADDAYDASPAHFAYETVYSGFMNWFQNVSATMPYMVSVGNHESECHSPACIIGGHAQALRNFSAYNTRYHMPSSSSNGVLNMWYSWNYGPVHFVSLNTETDFKGAGEENTGDSHDKSLPAGHFGRDGQYLEWLEADLKKANENRNIRPFIIAGGHRPLPIMEDKTIVNLFSQYGVDLYFAGHTHSYKRTSPFDQNGANMTRATTEIIVGGAGCDEMIDKSEYGKYTEQVFRSEGHPTVAPIVTATDAVASGVLRVLNRSALHWQLISSHTGAILDDVWITK